MTFACGHLIIIIISILLHVLVLADSKRGNNLALMLPGVSLCLLSSSWISLKWVYWSLFAEKQPPAAGNGLHVSRESSVERLLFFRKQKQDAQIHQSTVYLPEPSGAAEPIHHCYENMNLRRLKSWEATGVKLWWFHFTPAAAAACGVDTEDLWITLSEK